MIRPRTLPDGGSPALARGDLRASGIGIGSKAFRNEPIGMSVQAPETVAVAVRASTLSITTRPRYW